MAFFNTIGRKQSLTRADLVRHPHQPQHYGRKDRRAVVLHPWLLPAAPSSAGYDALLRNARPWDWGGVMRTTCRATTRKGVRCAGPVLAGFPMCRRHAGPAASRVRRERELRAFEAGRISPEQWARSEAQRTRNRICNQRRYKGGWLRPGLTLAFAPDLEAAFQEAARGVLGGRTWNGLPDPTRDRLRWAWRRYQLDRDRPEAWQAKARAILLALAARGTVPDGLEHDLGTGPHVIVVDRAPGGFSLRTTITDAELDKAKALFGQVQARLARAGRQRQAPPATPPALNLDAFLHAHGAGLRPVLALARTDAELRAVALAHRAVLAGELGGHAVWIRLVRRLRADAA